MFFLMTLIEILHLGVVGTLYDVACPLNESSLPTIMHRKKLLYVEECAIYCKIAGGAAFSFDKIDKLCTLFIRNIEVGSKTMCDYKENIKYFNRKSSSKCPDGWLTHAAQCFYKSNNTLSWDMAKQHCLQLGGNLATIRDNSTNMFLLEILDPVRKYWLGGNDKKLQGNWIWEGHNDLFSFTFWGKGQPNNFKGRQHCLLFIYHDNDKEMKWNDRRCTNHRNYLCEIIL